jgi:SAM-dependent methyltransferase
LEVQARAVAAVLPATPTSGAVRALDVGGGHGQLTPLLLERGYEIWVQGSAPVWSARLARLQQRHPERLHLLAADLWRLPFADRSFDLVLGFRLLAHVEATEALVDEMCRVSRNAVVVDYAPLWSANLLEPLLFRLKRMLEGNTRPFFCYTRRQLAGWLAARGFGEVHQVKQFWLPMVVHRKLASPERSAALEAFGRKLGLTGLIGAPVVLAARRGGA